MLPHERRFSERLKRWNWGNASPQIAKQGRPASATSSSGSGLGDGVVDGDVHLTVMRPSDRKAPPPPPAFQNGLIAKLHELQDILAAVPEAATEVPLSRIVVIGGQSSGKTSVLEALVGRDFLPKNKDICTRRPLILQLCRSAVEEEWGQFQHVPSVKFSDFAAIKEEIINETERGTESEWSISSTPIFLKIFSPNVLSMTLVDMPGIVRVPVGDQPDNIEDILRELTMEYARAPSTILLAVTAANSDIANSDAIKIAKAVDPEGERTLGVLTKLDIMDEGTDVTGYLRVERDPKLKLGYVGVVNRSQASIERHVTVAQSLRQEHAWFSNHTRATVYREIPHLCGTRSLAKRLNGLLAQHVQQNLQQLSATLRFQLRYAEDRLIEIGSGEVTTPEMRTELLHSLLHEFESKFNACVSGDHSHSEASLFGGAALLHHFRVLKRDLEQAKESCLSHSDEALLHTIHNAYGMESHVLMPEKAFRQLVPQAVAAMETPCRQCMTAVYEQFQRMAHTALEQLPTRFPALTLQLGEITEDVLRATLRPTLDAIETAFRLETAYLNTEHPSFIGGEEAAKQASEAMKTRRVAADASTAAQVSQFVTAPPVPTPSPDNSDAIRLEIREEDRYAVELTRILLRSYSGIVCQTLQDIVPKTIVHFFIDQVRFSALRQAFLKKLSHPEAIARLMTEDSDLENERIELRRKLKIYRRALNMLC